MPNQEYYYKKGLTAEKFNELKMLATQIERISNDMSMQMYIDDDGVKGIISKLEKIDANYSDLKNKISQYKNVREFIETNKNYLDENEKYELNTL